MSLEEAMKMSKEDREHMLARIEKRSYDNEVSYWGCTQAVLDALQWGFNLESEAAFKAASALAGGVAGMREVCGALVGGIMAIGLAYGRANFESGKVSHEQPASLEALVRSRKLCERFKDIFGTLQCGDLRVSIRGDNYKEYPRVDTIESFEDHAKCADVTGPAARLAAEIMLERRESFEDEISDLAADMVKVRNAQREQGRAR